MKPGRGILIASVAAALAVWGIDLLFDYLFVFSNTSFLDLLTFHVSPGKLHVRILMTVAILGFGAVMAWIFSRYQEFERRSQESERHFRGVMENIRAIAVIIAPDGRTTFCNDYLLQLTGRTREEVVNSDWFELYLPRDIFEPIRSMFLRHMASGNMPTHVENEILTADGRRLLIQWNNTILKDSNGACTGVACIGEDITEQRRTEQEHSLLSVAIDQADEIITLLDTQGRVQYVNSSFERISGYTAEDIIGQSWAILEDQLDEGSRLSGLWKALKVGRPWRGRLRAKRKDETCRELDVSVSPVRDDSGTIVNFVQIGRDISVQLSLEEQLRQAQKMEAVGRLTGGIAHDFNNLLTVINGYAELLQMDMAYDSPRLKDINEIAKASSKASELTRRLLAFSRKAVLRPKVLNINDVLRDLTRLLMRLIGENIQFRTNTDSALWNTRADIGQIEQVVFNLVANARDAMPEGGNLTIETRNVTLEGDCASMGSELIAGNYVFISVRDTGIGMDNGTIAKIFDPFFSTKGESGTGLGLATVYGIICQHEGHISCESTPGHGTIFSIYLPAVDEPVKPLTRAPDSTGRMRDIQTILLVEDEEDVLSISSQILERKNYHVLTAESGERAIDISEEYKGPIHLLITDLVLPDANGRAVADAIVRFRPGIRVLYISGYEEKTVAQHGILTIENEFLQKPFRVMDLYQKVHDLLADSASQPEEMYRYRSTSEDTDI